MGRVKSVRLFGIWLVVVLLVSLLLQAVMPVTPAMAAGGDIVLKYDDDEPIKYEVRGCPACSNFQGVRFSLPAGVPSAVVVSIAFYYKSPSYPTNPEIYIMKADQKTFLLRNAAMTVTGTGWQTFTIPSSVIVTEDFWVVIQRHTNDACPAQDSTNQSNRSFKSANLNELDTKLDGDLMIRATIRPEAHVGSGQKYATIQAAIDAVGTDVAVVVHDGTYTENVTVYKRLPIRSLNGPTTTIVTSADPRRDAFLVTASGVSISGFTIQRGTGTSSAGVRIQESNGCVISGNVILDNTYGVYVSRGSTMSILLENECKFNTYGVYVEGSQNYVSGNKIHGNTAPIGSAVFLSSSAADNTLRFNSITIDAGMAPGVASSEQVYNQNSLEEASAAENWWGSDSGPADAGGQGSRVGQNVVYSPWLTMPALRVKTGFTNAGGYDFAATEMATTVSKQGTGTPVLSTANFAQNPVGEFRKKTIGKFIDVWFGSTDGVESAEVRLYYTQADLDAAGIKEDSLKLYWWDGEKWKVCSDSRVEKDGDYVWAKVNATSNPGLSDLGGTLFVAGTFSKAFAWWLIPVIIVVVLVLLVAFRLFWVLVVKGQRM